jgi:2'-5' RNA ligase
MHGVVSLLDSTHDAQVERLWAELAATFGVRGVYVTPYPHFSYHVAAAYDLARLDPILQAVAGMTAPFRVRTAGLGIFTGAQPVLYLPVVRTAALSRVHAALWPAVASVASDSNSYYHPDRWLPHITIGFGDVSPERLAALIGPLAARSFDWEIAIDQFALIYDSGAGQVVRARYPFGQAAPPDQEEPV